MTTRFSSADAALCAWWKRKARDEAASALDPFAIKGRIPAKSCPSCGSRRHAETESREASEDEQRAGWRRVGWLDRCKRCGAPWDLLSRFIIKGRIQTSRIAGATEARAVESVDLDRVIDRLPRPDVLIYALSLVTDDSSEGGREALERAVGFRPTPSVRSYEFLAEVASRLALELRFEAPEIWSAPPGGFTPGFVRLAIRRCRRLLEAELQEIGAMRRVVPVLLRGGGRRQLNAFEPLPALVNVPAFEAAWLGSQDLEDLERIALERRTPTLVLELTSIREPHKRRRAAYQEIQA